jgi:hypothetical protein
MKKVFIIALAVLSVNAFAQSSFIVINTANSATLAPNDVISLTTTAYGNTNIVLDIKNITNTLTTTTKTYNVTRYDIHLNTSAVAYFCFGGNCYTYQTLTSPNPVVLSSGQSASQISGSYNMLTADLDEGPTVGQSLVKYTFKNVANTSDSLQISLKYNYAQPVGIKENSKTLSSFEIFPNPANEAVSIIINSPKSSESSIMLFNSIGQAVYQKNFLLNEGKNKIDLNLENLPAGVYFTSFKTGDSTISKRLIIN